MSTVTGNMPAAVSGRPPMTTRLALAARDIKLAHSVFALPFAILASFLARPSSRPWGAFAGQLAIVAACMFFARTWAMLVNRLADARLDALNPRTARRAVASQPALGRDFAAIALCCAAMFVACASLFWVLFANPWPTILAAPVLAWIALYSFTKRFTAACHLFLGGALAASPLAAAIAIDPASLGSTHAVIWLAGMVLLWVGGFDVIYALQDLDFDRRSGLHSIPARLGPRGAVWASRVLHAGAMAMLIAAASVDRRFGPIFYGAVGLVGVLLITEHAVLARRGRAGLNMAFFTLNGIVSCLLGVAGVADVLVG